MSASVPNVNSENRQTYSTEPLPGDEWETRRSKQIARAINRVRREKGMKSDELAARCSKFQGQEVKVSTINGLFAGKRKSISVPEVAMYAAALKVPTSDLLYPAGEDVEIRPGKFVTAADAVLISEVFPDGDIDAIVMGSRTYSLVELARRASTVTRIALEALRLHDAEIAEIVIERLRNAVLNLKSSWMELSLAGDRPNLPDTASWAITAEPDSIDSEFVKRLEPLFEGWDIEISDDREERRARGGHAFIQTVRIMRRVEDEDVDE